MGYMFPATSSFALGEVVPMPTLSVMVAGYRYPNEISLVHTPLLPDDMFPTAVSNASMLEVKVWASAT